MKHRVREVNPKSVRKWIKKLDDIETTPWSKRQHFMVGAAVLSVMLDVIPDVIEKKIVHRTYFGRNSSEVLLKLTPEFINKVMAGREERAMLQPVLKPMIVPPLPVSEKKHELRGGYITDAISDLLNLRVIKGRNGTRDDHQEFGHTPNTMTHLNEKECDMINRLGNVEWKVNAPILRIASEAVDKQIGPISFEPPMDMPTNVSAADWAKMSKEERGAVKRQREIVHSHNNRQNARKMASVRTLAVAEEFKDYSKIYFPHAVDFRGRVYPLPQDLHMQADDFTKSLLTFAKGKQLGETGLQWLAFHMANCFGMDKVDRQGQADWVNKHQAEIFDVASDPFGAGLEFWKQADEPWQFLAATIEYCSAWSHPVSPEYYISHLPVHVDGSCNGLQHLSAMGLDPVGAEAVNMTGGDRQDIYQIVADKVTKGVTQDAYMSLGDRVPPAKAWLGKVTRKTVKRGVMTTPYGVTKIGIRDQLIKDGMTDGLEGDPKVNADYLRDVMVDAIDSTILKGKEIMWWLQDCAEILADQDKPVHWSTPAGFYGREYYSRLHLVRATTLMGRLMLEDPTKATPKIDAKKQSQSVAPNIIHSFDAAHMTLCVLAAPDDMNFSMIHDSFGVHAADMNDFERLVKSVFVEMYSRENWLHKLHMEFQDQCSDGYRIPPPPERGDFDITEVLKSKFFFA
jgi:DNA-directed RNA polymerase